MTDFEHITWDTKYSVHVEAIDVQHQELFSIVNLLIDLHQSGSTELYPTFKNLVDYLSKHFHAEQMIMSEMRYPRIAAHIQQHQAFTEKIHEFLKGYKEQDRNLTQKMLFFLTNWIFSHTTDIDQQYGSYLQQTAEKG
jgi:hemerythrin